MVISPDLVEATMPLEAEIRAAVVVIAYAPPDLLARCLGALREQRAGRNDIEILIVAQPSHQSRTFDAVKAQFAEFIWVDATQSQNVARMRGLGVARSTAPVIALLEGDCVPAPGWFDALAQMTPAAAVGGAIEPGDFSRGVDWAAYFAEFGRYMLPLPKRTPQLPGANVVYRRAALPDPQQLQADGFYETFINSSIGDSHPTNSALVVRHERTWTLTTILATRFNHGRGFASLRTRGSSFAKRLPFMLLSIALPLVLIARVAGEPFKRRRLVARTIVTLPWIIALSVSWAAGEFAGYAAGPGSSLDKWR